MLRQEPLSVLRRHEHNLLQARVRVLARLETGADGERWTDLRLAVDRELYAIENQLTRLHVELIRRGC